VKVVALVPDLMDRSRVRAAVPEVAFVTDLRGVEADVVLVDVGRPGVLEQLGAVRAGRIVGFGAHVDHDRLADALAAGCTEVHPRSVFFRRLAALLDG